VNKFYKKWGEGASATAGFFWMALWAFVLGYIISKMIQIIDYTFYLNLALLAISGYLIYLGFFKKNDVDHQMHAMAPKSKVLKTALKYTAFVCYAWLVGGLLVKFLVKI
jgi:hypothetical protein